MADEKLGYVSVNDRTHLSKHVAVYDNDTEKRIEHCYAANDITGEYWVYLVDGNGALLRSADGESVLTEKRTGNIRFERTQ